MDNVRYVNTRGETINLVKAPLITNTKQFREFVYEIENGQIVSSQVVGTDGQGHGALAIILNDMHIDALICGGIGGGAQAALAQLGIKLYGGCQGSCDEAVKALITTSPRAGGQSRRI